MPQAQSNAELAVQGGPKAVTLNIPPALQGVTEIGQAEIDAVTHVLKRKTIWRFLNDDSVSESIALENKYRQWCDAEYALAVGGGTCALIAAMAGVGLGSGDEVIVPGYTYIATAAACLSVGAIPILCEIDESLTMDPSKIEQCITPYTKAIAPVHMRGSICAMDEILAVARKHNLKVIEDVAQANGGEYKGKRLGALGDAGAYSLQHYKVITAGEAGIVVTNDEQTYKRACIKHDSAMQFWKSDASWPSFAGENYRIDEMRSALGLVQFERMPGILKRCRSVKARLIEKTRDLPHIQQQKLNDPAGDVGIIYCFFTRTAEQAQRFSEALDAEGVSNQTIYNKQIPDRHIYNAWDYVMEKKTGDHTGWPWSAAHREISYQPDMLPATLDVLGRCVAIGLCQHWSDELVEQVAGAVRKVHDGLAEQGLLG